MRFDNDSYDLLMKSPGKAKKGLLCLPEFIKILWFRLSCFLFHSTLDMLKDVPVWWLGCPVPEHLELLCLEELWCRDGSMRRSTILLKKLTKIELNTYHTYWYMRIGCIMWRGDKTFVRDCMWFCAVCWHDVALTQPERSGFSPARCLSWLIRSGQGSVKVTLRTPLMPHEI